MSTTCHSISTSQTDQHGLLWIQTGCLQTCNDLLESGDGLLHVLFVHLVLLVFFGPFSRDVGKLRANASQFLLQVVLVSCEGNLPSFNVRDVGLQGGHALIGLFHSCCLLIDRGFRPALIFLKQVLLCFGFTLQLVVQLFEHVHHTGHWACNMGRIATRNDPRKQRREESLHCAVGLVSSASATEVIEHKSDRAGLEQQNHTENHIWYSHSTVQDMTNPSTAYHTELSARRANHQPYWILLQSRLHNLETFTLGAQIICPTPKHITDIHWRYLPLMYLYRQGLLYWSNSKPSFPPLHDGNSAQQKGRWLVPPRPWKSDCHPTLQHKMQKAKTSIEMCKKTAKHG